MEFLEDKKGASPFRFAESPARLKGLRRYTLMFVAVARPVSPGREKPLPPMAVAISGTLAHIPTTSTDDPSLPFEHRLGRIRLIEIDFSRRILVVRTPP